MVANNSGNQGGAGSVSMAMVEERLAGNAYRLIMAPSLQTAYYVPEGNSDRQTAAGVELNPDRNGLHVWQCSYQPCDRRP